MVKSKEKMESKKEYIAPLMEVLSVDTQVGPLCQSCPDEDACVDVIVGGSN